MKLLSATACSAMLLVCQPFAARAADAPRDVTPPSPSNRQVLDAGDDLAELMKQASLKIQTDQMEIEELTNRIQILKYLRDLGWKALPSDPAAILKNGEQPKK